jgi:hypothetical protein
VTQPAFRFDAAAHAYFLGAQRLWSVTEVLAAMRFVDPTYYTWASRMRGTAVHIAVEHHLRGGVDWESLKATSEAIGEDIEPYVRAAVRCLRETNFTPKRVELAGYHPLYLYGFRPDLDGFWPDGQEGLWDWKTGEYTTAWELQLGAYDEGVPRLSPNGARRKTAVQLKKDGTYRLHHMKDYNAGKVFLGIHAAHQWGLNKGVFHDDRAEVPQAADAVRA